MQPRGGYEPSRRQSLGLPQEMVWQGGREGADGFLPGTKAAHFLSQEPQTGKRKPAGLGGLGKAYSSFPCTHKRRQFFYLKEKR